MSLQDKMIARGIAALENLGRSTGHNVPAFDSLNKDEQDFLRRAVSVILDAAAATDMLAALEAAVDCGMVPVSSVADGGANKFSRHVEVADMIRTAIAKATGKE